MNHNTIIEVSQAVDNILISTEHLSSQYHEKIKELGNAILEVVAMGEGVGIKFVDPSDLPDGVHVVNGVTVTKVSGTVVSIG